MNTKRTITDIGIFDFTKIELMDSIDIYVDVKELSKSLKEDVDIAVKAAKKRYSKNYKKLIKKRGWKWSNKGVHTSSQLHISLKEDGHIEYELAVFFQDIENVELCDMVYLSINVVKYETELKKLINKFF